MEFSKNTVDAHRRTRRITARVVAIRVVGITLGSALMGSLVATAVAGNTPTETLAKPSCVLQPHCGAAQAASEAPAPLSAQPTLETLALHAALQNASAFGLLRALHEPAPTEPQQKWCKNSER